jgi:hypothetical protein
MKLNLKRYLCYSICAVTILSSCSDPEYADPKISTEATSPSASFLFLNASPDAPDLNLVINNESTEINSSAYTAVPITAFGVFQNTSLRAEGTSADIGGVLGSNDLVYRSANNGTNNFQAANGAKYTVIVVDSIWRPKPLRTLNSFKVGDTTYFNPLTGEYLSVIQRAQLSAAQKSKLVAIGTVPAGSTDPGGLRFYVTNDIFPTFPAATDSLAALRLINVAPLSTGLWVRLKPAAGNNVTLGSNVPYALGFPTQSPAVGSRTVTATTANFTLQVIAVDNVPNVYTLQVATDAAYTNVVYSQDNVTFDVGGVYSVITKGTLSTGISATILKYN